MNKEENRDNRHKARMERKKALMDERIGQSSDEKGLLLVHTGNGKGKSSSAFGMLARALGHGMHGAVVQFIKGRDSTGEERFFSTLPQVEFHVTGDGFTWDTQNREQDILTARKGWDLALGFLHDEKIDMLILDELNIVLKERYLPAEEVIQALADRPPHQHVIITGRGAPQSLIDAADTVTEMKLLKHAFSAGIKAQPGVEF
ncbi:MAG: cob(I)yrinic acid a,c-diamide adenosyltransferase [Candidatus Sedimenticola sp. 20ELBAFRAG]